MLFSLLLVLQSAGPLDVEGIWYTEDEQSQVEISRMNGTVSGEIVWYIGHDREVVFDDNNPDEALRNKEILGLEILGGFEPGEDKWRRGDIYDPTSGKTYRSAIFRIDAVTLGVQGCLGFICQTQRWRLVPEPRQMRVAREPVVRGDQAD